MTVKEIVKEWLETNGYDGLFYEGECGCLIDDLMPCALYASEFSAVCEPGYRQPPPAGYEDDYDFFVGPEKPKEKE